jgi:hypothetical protein
MDKTSRRKRLDGGKNVTFKAILKKEVRHSAYGKNGCVVDTTLLRKSSY